MRHAVVLLFCLLSIPAWAQNAPATPTEFPTSLTASVISAALIFMVPRTLDAVPVPQLSLWGLRGITALDPSLTVESTGGQLQLTTGGKLLFARPTPADAGAQPWAESVADLLQASFQASEPIRRAGPTGLLHSFFDELFNHLDPYSRYVPPLAAEPDRARRLGEAGAGLVLSQSGPAVMVQSVNADGPAADEGIQVGDRILAVDDDQTAGQDAATVMDWLRGAEGTTVSITVRPRSGRVRTVTLERVVIPPETVFVSMVYDALVIRILAFSQDTDQRLTHELARAFPATGGRGVRRPRGLVLDLRGNRGGLLRQAVAATELLLRDGLVAIATGRNPQADHEWTASGNDATDGRPVIVLVDGRTASAAEIMAAALADRSRAVVVGSSTLGKGLVQTITTLPDGAELFVTWSRVLAPMGWPIQGLGVLPQVCTSLGAASLDEQLATLNRGQSPILATALARHRSARAPLPPAEIVELRQACPAAEGRQADMVAVRYLLDHPAAYEAALIAPAP